MRLRSISSLEDRIAFLDDPDRRVLSTSPSSTSSLGSDSYYDELYETKKAYMVGFRSPWNRRLSAWLRSRPRHLRRAFRRNPTSCILTILKYILQIFCALLILVPIFAPSYKHPPAHYKALESRCHGGKNAEPGCANPHNEQVFISITLYDAGGRLAGGRWGDSLLQLIHLIGHKNVFLSIYESNSGPEGERALRSLKSRLRCRFSIVSDPETPKSDFPTVKLPDGSHRLKRLAFLSEMRNRALRPLDTFDPELGIVDYDRILFMNDIAFRPLDAAQLLFSTNVGPDGKAHYLSACGLDYKIPLKFYDLYAMRDAEGYSNGLPIFPIFSNAGQGLSRAAMLSETDAVPVSTCWGGIVAMDARYVQNQNKTLPEPGFQDIGRHVIDPANPRNVTSPVRFRYEPEIFYDACECCLFLADVTQVAKKQEASELGVYVNPYVRVAYKYSLLAWLPWIQRWERLFAIPQGILTPLFNLPTHNPHRTVREGQPFREEIWVGEGDAAHWEMVERRGRNAMFCGVREMQTIRTGTEPPYLRPFLGLTVFAGERTDDENWDNNDIPKGQTLYFPT
ncbi:hypothetical protein DL766_005410 [Monosporascus sp. MC13-8B]|uniref:Glycosyltransferase family 69 protein n=1 Tax=Monosporascus cannonballus TaxID=155416 RepID=A0ABY0HE96_9PEZI|nr:hypothetical protein DL763_007030 [Monosporascus cannonballus]RYO91475.1 hypothetical protein DL762_002201 [Monosporascus cannonballus]RYP29392.1 hypothetical protein DL766_005410 [Monosporascus sp. MC13-8B]